MLFFFCHQGYLFCSKTNSQFIYELVNNQHINLIIHTNLHSAGIFNAGGIASQMSDLALR